MAPSLLGGMGSQFNGCSRPRWMELVLLLFKPGVGTRDLFNDIPF